MKIGDTVLIKSYEAIYAGRSGKDEVSYGFYTEEHFFDLSMKPFCGKTEKIHEKVHKSFGDVFRLKNGWWWLDRWLIPEEFLTDEDFEL